MFSDNTETPDHSGGNASEYGAIELSISCFAIVGMLVRYSLGVLFGPEGLDTVTKTGTLGTDGVMFQNLPANIMGSFVMGFVVGLGGRLKERHPELVVGVTTGFCGCCTTFSSWNTAAAILAWNGLEGSLPYHKPRPQTPEPGPSLRSRPTQETHHTRRLILHGVP